MSDLNKCPHCNKSFIKLNQHITKSHHKYEFEVSKDNETVKMIHTFPNGNKEEVMFDHRTFIGEDETSHYQSHSPYELYYRHITKKMELSPVDQKNGKRIVVHLGRYTITNLR
jgi:hypothetical protein